MRDDSTSARLGASARDRAVRASHRERRVPSGGRALVLVGVLRSRLHPRGAPNALSTRLSNLLHGDRVRRSHFRVDHRLKVPRRLEVPDHEHLVQLRGERVYPLPPIQVRDAREEQQGQREPEHAQREHVRAARRRRRGDGEEHQVQRQEKAERRQSVSCLLYTSPSPRDS